MNAEPELKTELRGSVCLLTLNRPRQRNALSQKLGFSLREALLAADLDPAVRVVVITGEGAAFCAGADLKEASLADQRGLAYRSPMKRIERSIFELLIDSPKPSIAALNGPATAGGCELALACDLRVASDSAWLQLPEAKRGMGANFASVLLPQIVPPAIALEWLLTGRQIPMDEAQRWGLINRIASSDELLGTAMNLADDIASSAPLSVERIKLTYRKSAGMPLISGLHLDVGPDPYRSEDRKEGALAFVEKRPPVWKGK